MLKLHTIVAATFVALAAPAAAQQQHAATQLTPQQREGQPLFDGVALIGPPPADGSVRAAADRLAMRPTVSAERLAQATADEAVDPWLAFRPVFGESFTEARLPRTAAVFARVLAAAGPSIGETKGAQMRPRPFIADEHVMQCSPANDSLRTQSSYPSGHATLGWAWGLVLAELSDSHGSAALTRAREFGDSRVICGYHFQSDIDAARVLGAGVIARLHADPAFRRDMEAARRELARAYPR